jgi:integrase
MSEHTILHHHRLLHSLFERAIKWGIIKDNPVKKVDAPKKGHFEANIWQEEHIKKAVKIFEEGKYEKLELPFLFAAYLGMRRGEIIALQYKDIDLKRKILKVRHSIEFCNGNWRLKEPKTRYSRRELKLSDFLVTKILAHKKRQAKNRLKYGEEYIESDFVFTDERGELLRPDYITKTFRKFIKENNLPEIRFHDLRHSFCSILIRNGVDPRTVQRILGQADVDLTLSVYTHTVDSSKEEALKIYERLLS